MQCPKCQGTQLIKNGTIHNGKPKWKCKGCGRQFVLAPTQRRISDDTKQTIDKLLLERISLAGIVRVTGISLRWLQYYVNAKYAAVPRSVTITEQKKGACFWNAMNSGRLSAKSAARNGFGWRLTATHAQLLA